MADARMSLSSTTLSPLLRQKSAHCASLGPPAPCPAKFCSSREGPCPWQCAVGGVALPPAMEAMSTGALWHSPLQLQLEEDGSPAWPWPCGQVQAMAAQAGLSVGLFPLFLCDAAPGGAAAAPAASLLLLRLPCVSEASPRAKHCVLHAEPAGVLCLYWCSAPIRALPSPRRDEDRPLLQLLCLPCPFTLSSSLLWVPLQMTN